MQSLVDFLAPGWLPGEKPEDKRQRAYKALCSLCDPKGKPYINILIKELNKTFPNKKGKGDRYKVASPKDRKLAFRSLEKGTIRVTILLTPAVA